MDHRDDLAVIDDDFLHLFSSWFNRGFLVLRQHRLVDAGEPVGEDHPLRGGARDPRLERSARAHRFARPALLRVLPSGAGRRAVDLRRGRAHARHPGGDRADPVRRARAGRTRAGDDGGVLFDLQLPARAGRRVVRPFPDQAGGRGDRVAKSRACRPSSRCRRRRISPSGSSASARAEASPALSEDDRAALAALDRADWWQDEATAETVREPLLRAAAWYYLRARTRTRHAARFGRALPSRQRRAARAAQLPRRHVGAGAAAVARPDGELPLRSRTTSRRTTRPMRSSTRSSPQAR